MQCGIHNGRTIIIVGRVGGQSGYPPCCHFDSRANVSPIFDFESLFRSLFVKRLGCRWPPVSPPSVVPGRRWPPVSLRPWIRHGDKGRGTKVGIQARNVLWSVSRLCLCPFKMHDCDWSSSRLAQRWRRPRRTTDVSHTLPVYGIASAERDIALDVTEKLRFFGVVLRHRVHDCCDWQIEEQTSSWTASLLLASNASVVREVFLPKTELPDGDFVTVDAKHWKCWSSR